MNRFFILTLLTAFEFLPSMMANCKEEIAILPFQKNNLHHPSADTIFQIDTVFQYVIVYDTLYYYDSLPGVDTLAVYDTLTEITDSAIIIKKRLTLNLKEKKTVYFNKELKFIENPIREFEDEPESKNDKKTRNFSSPENSKKREKTRKNETINSESREKGIKIEPLTYFVRDTIIFFDTVISHEMVFDTVYFSNSETNADTTISHYTEFEKMGKLVMAIETVTFSVTRRESIFVEKNTRGSRKPQHELTQQSPPKKSNKTRAGTSHAGNNRWRRESHFAPREFPEQDVDYTTLLNGGLSVFEPSIHFSPENEDANDYTDCLNNNTTSKTSYGVTLSYSYFENRRGYEAGLGFSKYNFNFNHHYEDPDIDTSHYWEYFDKDIWEYDTTWYINIDTLLQTGDTLMVPNVDSTMIQVTDSIQKADYDTTFIKKSSTYNYSYSYLEIPVIGRFLLFDGKFSGQMAAGVIPSFLVSKSGKMPVNESGTMADATEITYDYGFSLSGYGAITFMYKFYGDYSLFVEPFIRRNLFTTLKNDEFLVKNNSWGVRFGLSYSLFSTKNKKLR